MERESEVCIMGSSNNSSILFKVHAMSDSHSNSRLKAEKGCFSFGSGVDRWLLIGMFAFVTLNVASFRSGTPSC